MPSRRRCRGWAFPRVRAAIPKRLMISSATLPIGLRGVQFGILGQVNFFATVVSTAISSKAFPIVTGVVESGVFRNINFDAGVAFLEISPQAFPIGAEIVQSGVLR